MMGCIPTRPSIDIRRQRETARIADGIIRWGRLGVSCQQACDALATRPPVVEVKPRAEDILLMVRSGMMTIREAREREFGSGEPPAYKRLACRRPLPGEE